MEKINLKSKNHFPNLKYSKTIIKNCEIYNKYDYIGVESFDIFKIENNEKKANFSGYYISTSNNETKDIDIYKIYSKDNIKKIYSLEVKYSDIYSLKYFYDSYHNAHYLTALINEKTNILIWKIKNEKEYELITNYKDVIEQGGCSMSIRPIRFSFYMLLFEKEQPSLLFAYNVQKFCTRKVTYFEKYDFVNNKKLDKLSTNNYCFRNKFEGYSINLDKKNYFGILKEGNFILYEIFASDLIKSLKENSNVLQFELSKYNNAIKNIVIIKENDEDKYLYYNEYYEENDNKIGKNFIGKIDLKNREKLFKAQIKIDELFSMTIWNKNYLLLFEKLSENIYIFNLKTFRIEGKLINSDDNIYTGKKLIINNNEELLFISELNGDINLWINES